MERERTGRHAGISRGGFSSLSATSHEDKDRDIFHRYDAQDFFEIGLTHEKLACMNDAKEFLFWVVTLFVKTTMRATMKSKHPSKTGPFEA